MPGKSIPAPREADLIWLCRRLASALHGDTSVLCALDAVADDAPPALAASLRAMRQSVRTGLFELLEIDYRLRELIARPTPTDELRDAAIEAGMTTMLKDGVEKAMQGVTTVEEVMRVLSPALDPQRQPG